MGELKKIEKKSCSCVMDQLQQLDGTQGKTWQETVAAVVSQADKGLNSVSFCICFVL